MSVSEYTLRCNFHKCRARLSGFAWVTACCHIFCDQHGSDEFSRTPAICPTCSSMLSGKLDVMRVELAPSERYKSMVLVGLKPHTVLEICQKALEFWTYQVHQERLLMEYKLSQAGGQAVQMEKFMTQQNQSRELELNALRGEIASLKKVLEEYKRKYSEVLERLNERNRQYQKLQGLFDSLRLHTLGTGEKDIVPNTFTTGLAKQRSPHSSPSFLAPEGDRFFSLGPENANAFFQFSSPSRDRTHTFIKKN
ncbi:E3 ubiquitin-protein ligase CCNB1IP1-like [Myxocyprinus asiaticus]|uniref:E3 ubiquitin-protein ligase CCNB1IP1-like n=1 Tax=Myxocyprinus asiaticus TaxID=70543 RepID=UPI002222690B|nr:E3 ubiquitin-protein ligase CCNB1IP1-like [Myxocyprinus asiaticus]